MKIIQTHIKHSRFYSSLNVASLNIGDVLVFDIYIRRKNNYIIIIEAGTILSTKLYEKLQKQDKLYISKNDEDKKQLSCESLKFYIKHNKNSLEKNLHFLYSINNEIFSNYLKSKDNQIDVNCVKSLVESIIFLIKDNRDYLKNTISHFSNEYELPIHSLHVCIYSINLGHALELDSNQLLLLGTAGLLHDLGIKKINSSIIDKDSKLSFSELESVHKHSKFGAEIVKQNHILDPYIIDAITHHHENYDGSGYPDHLDADYISDFASILAISDVFDALTNNRPYREAYSSFQALNIMMKDDSMKNKFNHKYLQLFLKSL